MRNQALTGPDRRILELAATRVARRARIPLSTKDVCGKRKSTERTVRRRLKGLVEAGLLTKVGKGPSTGYFLTEAGAEAVGRA